ncbi:hypothetical protein [Paraburkholderia tropica]|uniref:hypothetical protein n=1 Tax=Paraburkholderia tropica TaxID=92647 RepID=UPI0012E9D113|nr:hypothetical protein [Paraburkholderia tropica]
MSPAVDIPHPEAALYERVRLFLYAIDLPVQRLNEDIEDIGRFLDASGSSHIRLLKVMPQLLPASAEIVRAVIRIYGERLFTESGAAVLRALVKVGPLPFARAAVLIGDDGQAAPRIRELLNELDRVFEHYPNAGFTYAPQAHARRLR